MSCCGQPPPTPPPTLPPTPLPMADFHLARPVRVNEKRRPTTSATPVTKTADTIRTFGAKGGEIARYAVAAVASLYFLPPTLVTSMWAFSIAAATAGEKVSLPPHL